MPAIGIAHTGRNERAMHSDKDRGSEVSVSGSSFDRSHASFYPYIQLVYKAASTFFLSIYVPSDRNASALNVCEQTSERQALCIDFMIVFVACVRLHSRYTHTHNYTHLHTIARVKHR